MIWMQLLDFNSFEALVEESRSKKVMLTFHSLGDTDSVSSAVALSAYFENSRIVTPDYITSNAKRLLKQLKLDGISIGNEFWTDAETIVLLDVNNFEGCGAFADKLNAFTGNVLIIDHHAKQEISWNGKIFAFDSEDYNSTASIIYELLKKLGMKLNVQVAKLVALGIIADSAEFKNADSRTFLQIGELLSVAKVDYPSLMQEMESVPKPEFRVQVIGDLANAKLSVRSGLVFMCGAAHATANICADYGIKSGADIALFYSENNNELSFSARMRPPLDKELGIHLGKVMISIAGVINGSGGGHPCAAGAYGSNKNGRDEFIRLFEKNIFG